jgi:hypothetical protein
MTDPGLNHRLRQRSRRAGIMIGISMLLTITVCVGSFSIIYAQLDTIVGDFVTRNEPDQERVTEPAEVAAAAPTQPPSSEPTTALTPEPTDAPTEAPAEPTEEPDEDEFNPDYQIDSVGSVNLRSGPGTDTPAIRALPLEEPLLYLGESQESDNPARDGLAEGQVWMHFRTEDGEEGWVRELDVTEYVP